MKWKLLYAVLSLVVLGSAFNVAWANEQALKHFTGGMALCEIGYGLGGFLWDEQTEQYDPWSPGYLPKGIIARDDDHWRKCGLGVLTFVLVGVLTDQDEADMAWMLGGVYTDILFKTAYRAWVQKE